MEPAKTLQQRLTDLEAAVTRLAEIVSAATGEAVEAPAGPAAPNPTPQELATQPGDISFGSTPETPVASETPETPPVDTATTPENP